MELAKILIEREVVERALEALESRYETRCDCGWIDRYDDGAISSASKALRDALAVASAAPEE